MTQYISQWLIVAFVVQQFFVCVYRDFNGRERQEPGGFSGFISTIVAIAIHSVVFYCAGSFSVLLGKS